jgi:hypothetical protein
MWWRVQSEVILPRRQASFSIFFHRGVAGSTLASASGEDVFQSLKVFYLKQLADMDKFNPWSVRTDFD